MATKSIVLVFALFAVATLLTACGSSETAPESPVNTGDGASDAPVDQDTTVVIDDAILSENDNVEIGELI